MGRYYFTFGSLDRFPYKDTYLVVVASDRDDAVSGFREKYPDIDPGCMNCSGCYDEKQWEEAREHHSDQEPVNVIWTECCFGKKPAGYDDLLVYVPEMKQIIRIAEGSGDNLLWEDMEEGYVDYIYYEQYNIEAGMPEADGGKILLKESLREKYLCLADCIPDVLDMAYGDHAVDCRIM